MLKGKSKKDWWRIVFTGRVKARDQQIKLHPPPSAKSSALMQRRADEGRGGNTGGEVHSHDQGHAQR